MASTRDTIVSQIPNHILENHPRFFDFLEAYYEWLDQPDNPYGRLKNHMDYLAFQKSMDDYVDQMKQEYLVDVPESVLLDKELFIKWSKKFNITRGSHASYKFMFRLLFNEQDTEIYVPKENILRTSDGSWVSGESLMLVTNSGNQDKFQFQQIFQKRQIYKDIFEYAYANVQRVRVKYAGRYSLTELSITDIRGEFKEGYPIETESGGQEWMIPTVQSITVTNAGQNYQVGERVLVDNLTSNVVERAAEQAGSFDTRVSSFFSDLDITVEVNGTPTSNFTFDGRTVGSNDIADGDTVKVIFPPYDGYLVVGDTDSNGGILNIDVLDLPIGASEGDSITVDGIGSGATGTVSEGFTKPVDGYYEDTKGQLSSNMFLQDSFFYQDYSYVIRTQQDLDAYSEIVKEVLHPSGFLMFGQISVLNLIELILSVADDIQETLPTEQDIVPKYGLGANYSFVDKFKHALSLRLYRMVHFNPLDMELVLGNEGYDLEAQNLGKVTSYEYFRTYIEAGYYEDDDYFKSNEVSKGWMTKAGLSDYYLYIQEDYTDQPDSGDLYFETGYVSTRTS